MKRSLPIYNLGGKRAANRFGWAEALLLFASVALQAPGSTPDILFVGVWDRAVPLVMDAGRNLNLRITTFRPQELAGLLREPATAGRGDLVFLLNLDSSDALTLKDCFGAAAAANPGRKIIALDRRPAQMELEKAGLLTMDASVPKYWRPNGARNVQRMLQYAAITYLGRAGQIDPPVPVPDFGYYDPEREEPFTTFDSCRTFKADRHRWCSGASVAAILIQQSFWITHDTKVVDAEIYALEKEGINAMVIFGDSQDQVANLLKETHPDILVEDRHGAMWESPKLLEELDVPYLRPVSMLAYTLEEWRDDPQGLARRDVGTFMALQESWGTIEPVVVGGLKANLSGYRLHEPLPSGVRQFARRAAAWLNLRSKPNSQKKVAFIYYNKGLGKDDLMRGSPTGAFLDGPQSFIELLPRLQQRGYSLTNAPQDAAELVSRMRRQGHNLAPWMQGELEELVKSGSPALVPMARFMAWFNEKLSLKNRQAMTNYYGPPPGRIMVVERLGEPCIVIPRIELGNVILAPQPERGETMDEKLLHSREVPPPYNYLAFYWWMEEEAKADVLIHWGTHGTLELLPGKEAGLSRDCWSDICVGSLPIVDLWIMDNLGEATLAKRRSYAQLVDHMVPPAVNAGAADMFVDLHDELFKFGSLEQGMLRNEYRKKISARVVAEKLDAQLGLKPADGLLSDQDIRQVSEHIDFLFEERTPLTLHVLGRPPAAGFLPDYLVSILGGPFRQHLEAALPTSNAPASGVEKRLWLEKIGSRWLGERLCLAKGANALEGPNSGPSPSTGSCAPGSASELPSFVSTPALEKDLVFASQMLDRLNRAPEETTGLLRALEGRYLLPGPGPDPIRNPNSAPGGRNLYALNPEEIPTRPAWEVAVQLVDEMLRTRRPRKVGMDLNGMETMRDFGVMEAQILYLMGVRPVWDRNNLAIDVELIGRDQLKRPRIDVFVAMGGMYKENFPTRVELLDKAIRLAAAAKEEDNAVRSGTERMRARLAAAGIPDDRACQLATARIFGAKPGDMSGTKILYLAPRSGVWSKEDEIADVYIDNMSFVYTKGTWGQKVDGLYEQAIQGTEVLVRVWASNTTSQLANHHAYEYLGGLSMAVRKLTGKEPAALIADVRDPNGAKMRDFQEVLMTSMQAELLNRKWIAGMKDHGYAGAGHAAELVKNTFGWSVTRPGSISDATWNEINAVYVEDKYQLDLREWFEKQNPHALAELTATMLEAARTSHWHASPELVSKLSHTYAELVASHGESGGLVSGGNQKLQEFVTRQLGAPGDAAGAALAAKLSAVLSQSKGAPAPNAAAQAAKLSSSPLRRTVTGQRMATVEPAGQSPKAAGNSSMAGDLGVAGGIPTLLVMFGFVRRKGAM